MRPISIFFSLVHVFRRKRNLDMKYFNNWYNIIILDDLILKGLVRETVELKVTENCKNK